MMGWVRAVLAAGVLASCDTRAKNEATSLAMAIDRYREGSALERPGRAATVMGMPCTHPVTCATKEACLETITPFVEGLQLQEEGRRKIQAISDGGPIVADLEAIHAADAVLAKASERVARAEAMRLGCEQALEAQRKEFRY